MEKNANSKDIRNPFIGATDEKQVWKDLLKASKPVSKDEFLQKAREARQARKEK